ncbi:MAG: HAMP domain-containing histidine kinase [Ruminococcaceae bacterium]|nr:HAMP domain-containing histidine kinase [Oscillospiraceae bacterium]
MCKKEGRPMSDRRHEILEKLQRPDAETLENRKRYFKLTAMFSVIVAVVLLVTSIIIIGGAILLHKLKILKKLPDLSLASTRLAGVLVALFSILIGTGLSASVMQVPLRLMEEYIDMIDRLTHGNFDTRIRIPAILRRFRPFLELEESFNKLAEELGRNEMLRTDFIHDFSHEFKTPIVSISGFAKLLQKGNLSEEQEKEYLEIIRTESEKLSNMAMNVLDMNKLDNVSVLTDITRFNLSEQLRHCVLMLEKKWTEKRQEIDIDLEEFYLSGNEDMLSEVWINLLDNAIKFSPVGGKIIVKVRPKDNWLAVEVRNTGETIPDKDKDRIFDKFYQTDPSHATAGNGLGLSICKRIVELHHGTISVTSTFGLTVFTVNLPQIL